MTYDNILKAMSGQNQSQPPVHEESNKISRQLSTLEQSQNYETFSMLMKEGVYLPDLIKRLDDMEAKVKALESQPKQDTNAELLAVMEQAVRNHPEVKASRQHVADVKSAIITEMCMQDQRYRDALEAYKTTVNKVYIQTRESNGGSERIAEEVETPQRGGAVEVRDDSEGRIQDQEGLS